MQNKRSFFERLTGAVRLEDEGEQTKHLPDREAAAKPNIFEENDEEARLTVDVFQTPSEIVVKTMVAGVKPEDLDVSITRDSVTIRGKRSEDRTVSDDEYLHRELYWGSFARVIPLPEEIEAYAPFLARQIEIIKPEIIATLGRFAMAYIMKRFSLENSLDSISRLHGRIFETEASYGKIKVIPLYHPAVAVYNANTKEELLQDFQTLRSGIE